MTRWQLQLDVPWRQRDVHGYADPGGIAIDRARHRPLAPAFAGDRYALAAVDASGGAVTLTLRPDARWRDGGRLDAGEVATTIAAALADHPLARLCGAGTPRPLRGDRVEVPARAAALLATWLAAPRFAPRRADTATGAFALDGDHLRGPDCDIELSIVSRPHEALARLDRAGAAPGLTCPTAFDVGEAARRGGRRDLRRAPSDLHMVLLVNPERAPALAEIGGRAALAHRLGVALAGAHPKAALAPQGLSLLVGDYWPNRDVAALVAGAARDLGLEITDAPVDLDALTARVTTLDFDLALVLVAGEITGAAALASWMAALVNDDEAGPLAAALDAGGVRAAVAALEPVLPVLPLCQLAAAYVASPAVPVTPLVQGVAYPVDRLVEHAA